MYIRKCDVFSKAGLKPYEEVFKKGVAFVVELSDGSTAQERLYTYTHSTYFSYTVSNFSGSLRFLTSSANGEWWFEQQTSGQTAVKWRYAFNARSIVAVPILWGIANVLWHRYMAKALSLAKNKIEVTASKLR
ncbi:MAG: hypothetical protein AAF629_30900 [Chloroflexota bacterium]